MSDWYARLVMQLVASASPSSSAGLGADADVSRALADHQLTVGGSAVLSRTAGDLGGTFTVRGGLVRPDQVQTEQVSILVTRFAHTVEISTLPSLHAPRDRLRAPYDSVASTLWIEPLHMTEMADSLSGGICPLTVTWGHDEQLVAGVRHAREHVSFGFSAATYCRAPIGAPPRWCLSILELEVDVVGGALPATGGRLAPVAVDHVAAGAWEIDALIGLGMGSIEIPAEDRPEPDPSTAYMGCEERGTCVSRNELAYDLGARGHAGDAAVALRAHRTTYPTLTGELASEDRAEVTVGRSVSRLDLAAHGFAARTRWWTLGDGELDLVGAAITGGADVSAARTFGAWQVEASAEVARSFYASHDGGAPRAELGAQGTISMSRALERTW